MKFLLSLFLSLLTFLPSFAQIKITTTIKPLADISKEIVKEKGDITYIIPPNVSVHFYEYKVSDIKEVFHSDIFVFIGSGEPNIDNLVKNAKGKKIKVIGLKNLHRITSFEFSHEHHHSGEKVHPAVWLDPYNGYVIAEAVYKIASEIDPENKDFYKKNLEIFKRKVEKVLKEGKEKIASLKDRYFISYHYAWPYFTEAFGFIYLDVIELGHEREPTLKHLLEIIKKIKKYNIKSIFAAKQFYNPRYGELIRKQTGVDIVFLDPFGENKDYIDMLLFNINKVYQHLRK